MHLGIDLGTSNSAITGIDDGQVRLFKTDDGKDVLASMIHYRRGGRMVIGTRAQAQAELSPENVAQGFKRLMGTSSVLTLSGADMTLTPEDASAEILKALVRQAEAEIGQIEPYGTVITIPAAFNQMQSEATIRAAQAAGLERVGLLQEPIAAAMSALEGVSRKDGRFLVYDIGGGTFDLALVEASGGAVTIIAHEGVNMLGGRDFDRVILDSIVRGWLIENFDLDAEDLRRPENRRLLAIAKMKAEAAKIELSTRDVATLFLSEEEARAEDRSGEPIYIEMDITRTQIEALIADRIDETVGLCRKILSDNGLTHEDIDRIVFIGGPSKMPVIRERVSRELGIPADLNTDPMTAVARGAAIFAESREWNDSGSSRKSARGKVESNGPVNMAITFNARSSGEMARVRVEADVAGRVCQLRIAGHDGFDSGLMPFDGSASQTVGLSRLGKNGFRIDLLDQGGGQVLASEEIFIDRTAATASAIPATQTVAIKISTGGALDRRNKLEPLIRKGTPLPTKGVEVFKLREALDRKLDNHFDVELFNQAEGVEEPHLNLAIGVIRIAADDVLTDRNGLAAGSEVHVEYEMDDNGLMKCAVTIPDLEVTLSDHRFYLPEVSHENFTGAEGHALAASRIAEAREAAAHASSALAGSDNGKIAEISRRLDRQEELLRSSDDPEVRKSVMEEALHIQQDLSRLRTNPETQRQILIADVDEIEDQVAGMAPDMEPETLQRINSLIHSCREQIGYKEYKKANELVEQIRSIISRFLSQQPEFVIGAFKHFAAQRAEALDKTAHDRAVQAGLRALEQQDIEGVRDAIGELLRNRMPGSRETASIAALAGLVR